MGKEKGTEKGVCVDWLDGGFSDLPCSLMINLPSDDQPCPVFIAMLDLVSFSSHAPVIFKRLINAGSRHEGT